MYNNPLFDIFLDHNMKLYKMIEIYLKYDNMNTFRVLNAFICINNYVISCINSMSSLLKPFYFLGRLVYDLVLLFLKT